MRAQRVVLLAILGSALAGATLAQEPTAQPAAPPPPEARQQQRSFSQNLFYGGYVGLSFGTVQYVELAPLLGYRFSPDFGAGVGVLYRYRKDERYEPSASLNDYGANLFARYHVGAGVFVQAEYDYTDYEYLPSSFSSATARQSYSSYLAGLGFTTAVGRGTGLYALVLYDFNYSASDTHNPYNSPWQYRFGVSVGF